MTDQDVAKLRATLDQALEQLGQALERIDALEAERRDTPPPAAVESTVGGQDRKLVMGRRRALVGLAGAAAAGAATVAGSARPAAAANGDDLRIGSDVNVGTAATGLSVQGTTAKYGLGATDNGADFVYAKAGVWGHAKGQAFTTGVVGQSDSGGTGVVGTAAGGTGVFATSLGGIGLRAFGETQILIDPNNDASPPADTGSNPRGALRWANVDGAFWACIADGTPGTWRKIVGTGTAGAFHLLPAPKRVYDSRPGSQPAQEPKTPLPTGNVARTIDLKHNASGVPAGATGVLLTVLLVNAATGGGNMTVWANDQPKPSANTMVWGGNAGRFATTALTAVDPQARVKIDASLTTDIVLDVVGYYR